jgi:hypothetical protein
MRKLIIRLFRINVAGSSRQQAEQQLYELIKEYGPKLKDDIKENYHIEDIWLPITQGDSKVDVIYPPKFEDEDLNLEDLEN